MPDSAVIGMCFVFVDRFYGFVHMPRAPGQYYYNGSNGPRVDVVSFMSVPAILSHWSGALAHHTPSQCSSNHLLPCARGSASY